ncbi:MAG: hypothetical protein Q4C22_07400, partial [Bacillota bacterium]|nr:hypothetical protein [Bacillota bacterium]
MQRAAGLPGIFFLAVWAALFGMAGFLGQTQAFYWIKAFSLYAAGVLLLIVVFDWLDSRKVLLPAAMARVLEKKDKIPRPAELLRRRKKAGAG